MSYARSWDRRVNTDAVRLVELLIDLRGTADVSVLAHVDESLRARPIDVQLWEGLAVMEYRRWLGTVERYWRAADLPGALRSRWGGPAVRAWGS